MRPQLLLLSILTLLQPFNVIAQDNSVSIEIDNIRERCDGFASVSMVVWNGQMPYEFNFSGADAYIEDSSLSPLGTFYYVTITDVTYGANTITVTDTQGLTGEIAFDVLEPPSISAEIIAQDLLSCESSCEGILSVELSPSPCIDQTLTPYGFCPTVVTPVVGCDGQTYNNACEAIVFWGISSWTGPGPGESGTVYSYSFQWDDPLQQTSAVATTLCPGTYTVTITRDADFFSGPCELVLSHTIEAKNLPTVSIEEIVPESNNQMNGQINISVVNGTPPYFFQWTLDEEIISNEEDPAGLASGTYTLIVTDANDCMVEMTDIVVSFVSDIITTAVDEAIKVFPNPSNGLIHITSIYSTIDLTPLHLFDARGKEIDISFQSSKGNEFILDGTDLKNGIYILSLQSEGKQIIKRISIVN